MRDVQWTLRVTKKERERERETKVTKRKRKKNDKMQLISRKNDVYSHTLHVIVNDIVSSTSILLYIQAGCAAMHRVCAHKENTYIYIFIITLRRS